jgi:hypothetical protein
MNQSFSGHQIDVLVDEVTVNLDIALRLCEESEKTRFKNAEPGH